MSTNSRIVIPGSARRVLLDNNSTEGDFFVPADRPGSNPPTETDESGDPSANFAVIDPGGAAVIDLQFFGTDAANEAFGVQVWGWTKYAGGDYTADLLAHVDVTLGALTGRDGGIGSGQFYADQIAEGSLGVRASSAIFSPGNDLKANLQLSLNGESFLTVMFDLATAASANGSYFLS